jgi:hypothetical protein
LERDERGRKIRAQEPKQTREKGEESVAGDVRKRKLKMKPRDESIDKPEMFGHMLGVRRMRYRLRAIVLQEKGVRLVLAGFVAG